MILQRGIRTVPPEKSIQYRLDDRPSSNSHFGVGRTTKGSKFRGKASILKKSATQISGSSSVTEYTRQTKNFVECTKHTRQTIDFAECH